MKSKIYTKTGDLGETSLIGGTRVSKTDGRIEAYGTVDELNSFIGLLLAEGVAQEDQLLLIVVQNKLFDIGAYLATDRGMQQISIPSVVSSADLAVMELRIDQIDSLVPPLKSFVLPGGSKSAAQAHVCRTVCRRTERELLRLHALCKLDLELMRYINRLSDYLFVLSRFCNVTSQVEEVLWSPTTS